MDSSTTLIGRFVNLVPLDSDSHSRPLFELTNGSAITLLGRTVPKYDSDAVIWRYSFDSPCSTVEEMAATLSKRIRTPRAMAFCVLEKTTGTPVGIMNFLNDFPEHRKIEIGGIWLSPVMQGTKANSEGVYLLLSHAFSAGYRRLEWKCDNLNERSKKAALRLGFTAEGVQQCHMIVKGKSRDTAWFRILDSEWERIKLNLETMLYTTDDLGWG